MLGSDLNLWLNWSDSLYLNADFEKSRLLFGNEVELNKFALIGDLAEIAGSESFTFVSHSLAFYLKLDLIIREQCFVCFCKFVCKFILKLFVTLDCFIRGETKLVRYCSSRP